MDHVIARLDSSDVCVGIQSVVVSVCLAEYLPNLTDDFIAVTLSD